MRTEITDKEAIALISMTRMLKQPPESVPDFLNWVADRLVDLNKDDPSVDFVQHLRRLSRQLNEVSIELGINR